MTVGSTVESGFFFFFLRLGVRPLVVVDFLEAVGRNLRKVKALRFAEGLSPGWGKSNSQSPW